MRHYGIIGNPLTHSFSPGYFTQKFADEGIDATYCAYEIPDLSNIATIMKQLYGFNVTYPYKELILPHLHRVDSVAANIGAVNVVCNGKGYNTDWLGFLQSIKPHLLPEDKMVLVLGTGGVSKAVQYALDVLGLHYTVVSRTPKGNAIAYSDLTPECIAMHTVIVNCTPLGMFPEVDTLPDIPYNYLTNSHLLYDCVYNPEQTAFLREGSQRGARTINGLQMLHLQADEAWRIWSENNG